MYVSGNDRHFTLLSSPLQAISSQHCRVSRLQAVSIQQTFTILTFSKEIETSSLRRIYSCIWKKYAVNLYSTKLSMAPS